MDICRGLIQQIAFFPFPYLNISFIYSIHMHRYKNEISCVPGKINERKGWQRVRETEVVETKEEGHGLD